MPIKDTTEIFKHIGLVTELGLTMVSTILVGFGIGFFIDKKAGHFPLWTIVGLLVGIISGFWSVYKLIMSKIK
ncbi:MAG: AtpZ/AtpI family protein [Candidatus Omnitrophica bacterium]|nr:AtpZ/AtpI family protein [Candidatus Omnitrophota bacterium]